LAVVVRPLTGPNFFSALQNRWISSTEIALNSAQAKYILGYLISPDIGALCFIEETPYVDGDYLEDHASFYVSSFPPYDRYCRRLHFFDRDFSQADVDEMLTGDDPQRARALGESYVGFIVVRPLPEAVVGRTTLRTYRDDGGRRQFPTIRDYTPYLNGIPLPIRSLAFEEQDSSVAACATVALWSAFHKTHLLFGTPRPRPAAITRAANAVRSPGRALPSGGLNTAQIGEAMRTVGLEPEFYTVTEPAPMLPSLAYAYLSAEIPLILMVYIEQRGYHAVTIVGYSLPEAVSATPEAAFKDVISYPGLRIDRFYVHDDGIGPFVSLRIAATPAGVATPTGFVPPLVFETNWTLERPVGQRTTAYFLPECLMVPAYPKMRVPFFAMHDWLARLMKMFTTLRLPFQNNGLNVASLSWDLRLQQVNEFKSDLRQGGFWENQSIRELSQEFLPRFLWLATMRHNDVPTLLLVSDATDTKRTCPVLRVVWLDQTFKRLLDTMFADPAFEAVWRMPLSPRFYDAVKTGRATL
jgi:hypothetical protein